MLGFGAVSERPLSTLAAVAANAIFALTSGYFEAPVEETPDSVVYQIIEDAPLVGSGATTESGDIAAGSGAQSTTGTGSPTEAADTASGAGSQSLTGSGATTEGADVAAGSGSRSLSGTGSATESADVAAGTGTAGTTGTGSATEAADTAVGSGSQSTSGSGATTEGGDVASGTGSQAGALAVMLRAGYYEVAPERIEVYGSFLAFVAQAASNSGTGSAIEGGDVASGTGTTSPVGSGSATEGGDTSTGVGAVIGETVLCIDFPDYDWAEESVIESVWSQIFDQAIAIGVGVGTESGDVAAGIGDFGSGGPSRWIVYPSSQRSGDVTGGRSVRVSR